MPNKFLFADEAGDFAFNNAPRSSRYFILCTVTMDDCAIGHDLLTLRRSMAFHHNPKRRFFHCIADPWPAREAVFQVLQRHNFRIDATIFEKRKAQPKTRTTDVRFFNYVWYYHFKYLAPRIYRNGDRLLITAASINQNNQKAAFSGAIHDCAQQALRQQAWKVAFLNSADDPCLWVADYCAWALQRKWETGERRAYDYIARHVRSEFEIWRYGRDTFY